MLYVSWDFLSSFVYRIVSLKNGCSGLSRWCWKPSLLIDLLFHAVHLFSMVISIHFHHTSNIHLAPGSMTPLHVISQGCWACIYIRFWLHLHQILIKPLNDIYVRLLSLAGLYFWRNMHLFKFCNYAIGLLQNDAIISIWEDKHSGGSRKKNLK